MQMTKVRKASQAGSWAYFCAAAFAIGPFLDSLRLLAACATAAAKTLPHLRLALWLQRPALLIALLAEKQQTQLVMQMKRQIARPSMLLSAPLKTMRIAQAEQQERQRAQDCESIACLRIAAVTRQTQKTRQTKQKQMPNQMKQERAAPKVRKAAPRARWRAIATAQ